MHLRFKRPALAVLLFLALAASAAARVISYAPYTNRAAIPGVQHRANRYFALFETAQVDEQPNFMPSGAPPGQVVVYDSRSVDEPRVIFPQDGTFASVSLLAVREQRSVLINFPFEAHSLSFLIRTDYNFEGTNPNRRHIFLFSNNGGNTWTRLPISDTANVNSQLFNSIDVGGPFVRGRHSQIRVGNQQYPFYIGFAGDKGVYSVSASGVVREIAKAETNVYAPLLGTTQDGSKVIVRKSPTSFVALDPTLSDPVVKTFEMEDVGSQYEAWGTNDLSGLYLEAANRKVWFYGPFGREVVIAAKDNPTPNILISPPIYDYGNFFAVPTYDYDGAWVIERYWDSPTTLYLHRRLSGLLKQFEDPAKPQIEAVHPGASGNTLLLQVHRPRPLADQRFFQDPALAIWRVGQPAPQLYDELFMNEKPSKGFVHLEVDKLESGEPFVFDSGSEIPSGGIIVSPPMPGAGGGDVIQEWGVVRASLKQRLVLPGVGRTRGGYNSDWASDVILQTPAGVAQKVTIRYVENGATEISASALRQVDVTLAPREIRLIEDAVKALFGIEVGSGAFFLTPEGAINAASRTYSKSAKGTFGFNMNAIDAFNAASARFKVSFSGAFPGPNFRTNLVLTDVSDGGVTARLGAVGLSGAMGDNGIAFDAPAGGQAQFNNIGSPLRLSSGDNGALVVAPTRGFAIASVIAIDNLTNDPTYFPPDLPAPIVRTIPAIGHIDGANGSQFRSDLYLYNPSGKTRTVTLQVKAWDKQEQPSNLNFTLLPNEARIIRDVLYTAFGKTGMAKLRYQSQGDDEGVRVTARTYTIDPATGGTFGFLMPPFNNFQEAGHEDTLEILGTVHDPRFRTNLGLVDLSAFPTPGGVTSVKIEIVGSGGAVLDTFETIVPVAGGIQLNDLYRSRGIATEQGAVVLRITPINGMIGAFASMIDNETNDPSYIAAQLAAKQ